MVGVDTARPHDDAIERRATAHQHVASVVRWHERDGTSAVHPAQVIAASSSPSRGQPLRGIGVCGKSV